MTNLFKKAALAFGHWSGLKRQSTAEPQLDLIDPVAQAMTDPSMDDAQSITELPPLDAPAHAWGESLNGSTPAHDSEAAVAAGEFNSTPFADLPPAPDQPVTAGGLATEPIISSTTPDSLTPVPPIAAIHTESSVIEEAKPPIELKPAGIPTPKPSVTFTQLYELISNEVNKRTDNAITVYERLLAASREELQATRRSNRLAWSIGGVMTAVAAFGAIWSAGEVAATHVEVGSLKQQVVAGQHASIERDQLRLDIMKVREASAKIEIDDLKARLDQALVMSSDRNRLRADLEAVRKAKQEVEVELKLARGAATQPVSEARPASSKVLADNTPKVAGAERPDAWSTLLNGADEH